MENVFTIEQHPAHEIIHGEPVSIITDVQQVLCNGTRVAWCGCEAGRPLSFVRWYPAAFVAKVKQFVTEQVGAPHGVSQPPSPQAMAAAMSDETEDTDES